MKPSEVKLWRSRLFPLIDTFGRVEEEFAAALMVLGCIHHGDEWQALEPKQIDIAMKEACGDKGCLSHLQSSPFAPRPDMRGLVAKGFAEFIGDPDGTPAAPIRFTEKGLEVLRGVA